MQWFDCAALGKRSIVPTTREQAIKRDRVMVTERDLQQRSRKHRERRKEQRLPGRRRHEIHPKGIENISPDRCETDAKNDSLQRQDDETCCTYDDEESEQDLS